MQFLEGDYHYTKIFRALCFHVTDGVVVAVVASRRSHLLAVCWQFACWQSLRWWVAGGGSLAVISLSLPFLLSQVKGGSAARDPPGTKRQTNTQTEKFQTRTQETQRAQESNTAARHPPRSDHFRRFQVKRTSYSNSAHFLHRIAYVKKNVFYIFQQM